MSDGGLNVSASIFLTEDVCLQMDTGVTVEFDGVSYPSRIIECEQAITKRHPGRAVLGIIYLTGRPSIEAGAELVLIAGTEQRLGTATVIEVKR